MLRLDGLRQLAEHGGLADACHVLQADLLGTGGNHLVGNLAVVLDGVYRRGGDAERGLRRHAGSLGPLDAGNDIAGVVQTAEDAGDVDALGVLHLIPQLAHVVGHGVHTQGVQAAVEHVGLDAHFVERLAEGTDGQVRVLASHEVHLLEGTAVGLDAAEAAHVDNHRRYALQLVLARLELAARLPHVSVDEAELDSFLFHRLIILGCLFYSPAKLAIKDETSKFF